MLIIVTMPDADSHFTVTIKPDKYEAHLTNEKMPQKKSLLDLNAPVLTQLAEYWTDKYPTWVKCFSPRY